MCCLVEGLRAGEYFDGLKQFEMFTTVGWPHQRFDNTVIVFCIFLLRQQLDRSGRLRPAELLAYNETQKYCVEKEGTQRKYFDVCSLSPACIMCI